MGTKQMEQLRKLGPLNPGPGVQQHLQLLGVLIVVCCVLTQQGSGELGSQDEAGGPLGENDPKGQGKRQSGHGRGQSRVGAYCQRSHCLISSVACWGRAGSGNMVTDGRIPCLPAIAN